MYQNTLKNLYSTALDQELAKKMFKNGALVWINAQKAIPLHQVFHGISLSFRCRETIREDRFPFFVLFFPDLSYLSFWFSERTQGIDLEMNPGGVEVAW